MGNLSFASGVLLCAVPLAVTGLQSTPSAADGRWVLAYSFLCNADEIAVDSQHNVYALDLGDSYPPIPATIRVFTPEGEFLREGRGFDENARGFAIDENDEIYVVNYLHDRSNRIGWVDRYDSNFQPLGGWGYAHSDLEMGFGIDVRDGIAYIAAVHGVLKFTTDGALLAHFPGYMRDVEIVPDGSIWCGNSDAGYEGLVRHYSAEGEVLAEWSTILPGEESSGPNDIAVDSNQRVFVADGNALLLKIFRSDGTLDDSIPVWPFSVALDGDEVLYVGASYPIQLMKFVYTPLSVQPATWGRIKAAFD